VAQNLDENLKYLDALAELHRAAWARRGQPGGFRSPRFIHFHKALIQRLLPERAVELLRVSAGDQTVGYIYNFLLDGKVYFYQSGFAYEADPKIKPGLVTHYLAAQNYWERGFIEYDFMAGDARYKRSLAKSTRTLYWSWVERFNFRMTLIKIARKAKHFLRRQSHTEISNQADT
jgi:CelD/BcsL family acetyltransferase involved in cellulose biosynthesis